MASRGRRPAGPAELSPDIRVFAAGWLLACLLLQLCSELPSPIWYAAGSLFGGLVLLWAGRNSIACLLAALLLGLGYGSWTAQISLDDRLPVEQHGSERVIQGVISDLPEVKPGETGMVQRFLFAPLDDSLQQIRVGWYGAETRVQSGDCWALKLRLRTPRGSQNPGGLDYEGWLFRQGIDATATVREARRCERDATATVGRLRQRIANQLQAQLAGHPMLPFVLGLTLGDRSQMTDAHWQVLRRLGISHLLAISGLHIGLVSGFAFLLVSWLWRRVPAWTLVLPAMQAGALAAALAALLYAALAGFSLPTQRALIMLLLVLGAVLLRRPLSGSRLLAWALWLVLLIDPFAVAGAGFWLSFAAVGWIFYVLQARLSRPEGWRLWIGLQCVLGLALLPLTLLWFGEGSWMAPLTNLVMIPLFFVLVPLILMGSLLALADISWLQWPLQLGADSLWLIWQPLNVLAESIPLLASQGWISGLSAALALLGCLWLFAPRGWPARWLGLLLMLPLLLPARQEAPLQGALDVTVLDVGQGLAVVLRSAEHVLVYDAGPAWQGGFDAGAMVVAPYLRNAGVTHIDRVVLSHGDLDHRGGIPALRRELSVGHELGTAPGRDCEKGLQWYWDGVRFEVLHPGLPTGDDNNDSCVLRVSTGSQALLLTGDIESTAELRLLAEQSANLPADVLLVPHHGSASSSSIGLLNKASPELAIVASGWRNQWGLPADKVMRRYAARGIRVLNTAHTGAVRFRLDPDQGITSLRQYRQEARRFWHAD